MPELKWDPIATTSAKSMDVLARAISPTSSNPILSLNGAQSNSSTKHRTDSHSLSRDELTKKDDADWASFIPDHIFKALPSENTNSLSLPITIEYPRAVFALLDLSGYTKLTRELLLQDASPSWIGKIIQSSLGRVIELIVASGGDVAKFGGDAVMAVWYVNEDRNSNVTILKRAISCCIKSTFNVQKQPVIMPNGQSISLSLHSILHLGSATNIILGKAGKRVDSVWVGSACLTIGEQLHFASKNEIILTEAVRQQLQADVEQVNLPNKIVITNESNTMALLQLLQIESVYSHDLIRQDYLKQAKNNDCSQCILYLDPSVMARKPKSGHFVDMTELRQVTVLFVKLNPLVEPDWHDPSTVSLVASDLQDAVSASLEACDKLGVWRQIAVDDKGITMFIVFGLPPTAHESTCMPAVQCALQIQKRFEEYGLDRTAFRLAMALTSGRIFTGVVGCFGDLCRLEHALLGDTLNLAARIMDSPGALDEILCDKTTCEQLESYQRYETIAAETLKLKGIDHPVATWRIKKLSDKVVSPTEAQPPKRSFRSEGIQFHTAQDEAEWKKEFNQWRYEDKPKTIIIEGCSGSGKSTLAGRIRQYAQATNTLVWMLSSYEYESNIPMHTIRQLEHLLLDLLEQSQELKRQCPADIEKLQIKENLQILLTVLGEMPSQAMQVLERLNEITSNSSTGSKPEGDSLATSITISRNTASSFSMESNAVLVEDFVTRILNHVTEQIGRPLMIVMDDCQWQDAYSWQLTQRWIDQCPRVLVLLLSRPVIEYGNPKPFEAVVRRTTTFRRVVNEVTKERIGSLLKNYLNQLSNEKIESISSLLFERTGGNAFAVDVLFRQVVESGNLDVPKDTSAVFVAQFDHLNKDFQSFLQVACLIGQVFYVKDVALLSNFDINEDVNLQSVISGMDRYSFLMPLDNNLGIWKFRHCLIVEQIYRMMPENTVQKRHLEVAEFYEVLRKTTTSHRRLEMLPLIHKQFLLSGETNRAFKYSLKLITAHLRLRFHHDAIAMFTEHVQNHPLFDQLSNLEHGKVLLQVLHALRYVGNTNHLLETILPRLRDDIGFKVPKSGWKAMLRFILALTQNFDYWVKEKIPSVRLTDETNPELCIQFSLQILVDLEKIYGGWKQEGTTLLTMFNPFNYIIPYYSYMDESTKTCATTQNAIFVFGLGKFAVFDAIMKYLGFCSSDPQKNLILAAVGKSQVNQVQKHQKGYVFPLMNPHYLNDLALFYSVSMACLYYVDTRISKLYTKLLRPSLNDPMGYVRDQYMNNLCGYIIPLFYGYDNEIDTDLLHHSLAMQQADSNRNQNEKRMEIDFTVLVYGSTIYLLILRGYYWMPRYQHLVNYLYQWTQRTVIELQDRAYLRIYSVNLYHQLFSVRCDTVQDLQRLQHAFYLHCDKTNQSLGTMILRIMLGGASMMSAQSALIVTQYWPFKVIPLENDSFEVESFTPSNELLDAHSAMVKQLITFLKFSAQKLNDRTWLKHCPFTYMTFHLLIGIVQVLEGRFDKARVTLERGLIGKTEEQANNSFALFHQWLFLANAYQFEKSKSPVFKDNALHYFNSALKHYEKYELVWPVKNMKRLQTTRFKSLFEQT